MISPLPQFKWTATYNNIRMLDIYIPANIYLLKVNNRKNTVNIVDFEQVNVTWDTFSLRIY